MNRIGVVSFCFADMPQDFLCYLFRCFMMLAIICFEATPAAQIICLVPIKKTNKCSMSKTSRGFSSRCVLAHQAQQIPRLVQCFCQRGSYCGSVTLHALGTADHSCMHWVLLSPRVVQTWSNNSAGTQGCQGVQENNNPAVMFRISEMIHFNE